MIIDQILCEYYILVDHSLYGKYPKNDLALSSNSYTPKLELQEWYWMYYLKLFKYHVLLHVMY